MRSLKARYLAVRAEGIDVFGGADWSGAAAGEHVATHLADADLMARDDFDLLDEAQADTMKAADDTDDV